MVNFEDKLSAQYGLQNYNNSNALYVNKTGYKAVENAEWKCLSGCSTSGKTFNQVSDYSASEFCDASYGNCTVILGVNWTPINYNISYDLVGGSVSTSNPSSYTIESNNITLNNPTKAGYTFTGWTGSNGSSPNKTVTIIKGSTGNKSYTANWEASTYTITYNANGGSGAPSSQTENVGTSTTLSSTIPTYKSGTTYLQFTGWNTKSDGTGTNYSAGADYSGSSNVTLYAQWHTHTWNAIGNTFFGTGGQFTCGYIHTRAYHYYCGGCGMSVRHYNNKHGLTSESSGYISPMACPAYISLSTFFDDSSLFNSNDVYDVSAVVAWGGIYNGGSKLPSSSKPATNSSEHKPNISISSIRVGSETGSHYDGSWANQSIYATVSYSGNGPAIDLSTLQYGFNNSWITLTSSNTPSISSTSCLDVVRFQTQNTTIYYKICDVKSNCATTSFDLKQDMNEPSCEITYTTIGKKAILTVTGSDAYSGLAASPYSWTSASSGFSTTKTKTVITSGTYYAWVKDAAGNVGSCSTYVTVGTGTITPTIK